MKQIQLYTDGACSGNPGPGGWAAILCYGGRERVLSGGEADTTNNRMELTAAIQGLQALKEPCQVALYSDSRYLVDAVRLGWVYGWEKKSWMRNRSDPVKNPELWQSLLRLLRQHQVELHWVKGHADNPYNQRCDALAVEESRRISSKSKPVSH